MADYRKTLIVKPGAAVRLHDLDPDEHGGRANGADVAEELAEAQRRIGDLQLRLYAERKQSLLVVLQGLDASGKDGVCRHAMSALDPEGTTVTAFKEPTKLDLAHDFLWRVHPHAPAVGEVAIFNRSHYEDVLVVRVHNLVPEKTWARRYDLINDFERLLASRRTRVIKFFLHISKEEQLSRFRQRLEDPTRNWKIAESDYLEREYWDDYAAAYEAVLEKCSTADAPWYVIPSNHKWFRDLAVSHIVASTLEDMGPGYPAPTVDLGEIRRQYHRAVAEARGEAPGKKGKR